MSGFPVFDCHADILMDVVKRRLAGETGTFRRFHLDRLRAGGIAGAVLIHCHMYDTPAGPEDVESFIRLFRDEDSENSGVWRKLATGEDAAWAEAHFREAADAAEGTAKSASGAAADGLPDAGRKDDPLPVVVGMEGLKAVKGDFSLVERMYREASLRLVSLTQNDENDLATGHWGDPKRGLTERGREFVRKLNDLGVLIDLAHANEPCRREILELSSRPVLMSHTSAKAVYDNGRNYSDAELKAVAEAGGCVGCMTSAAALAAEADTAHHTLERYLEHLERMVEVAGEDHVVLGLHYTEYLYPGPGYLSTRGLEDASRTQNLVAALRARGWQDAALEKLCWKNFFRLFRAALG